MDSAQYRSNFMPAVDPNAEPFERLDPPAAREKVSAGKATLVDVREPNEWDEGHAEGALHIPLNRVFTEPASLPAGDLVFICSVGQRSALACEYAAAVGRVGLANVEGGTDAWKAAGLPMA
jgi:rhodanese-related sulfurtransferase